MKATITEIGQIQTSSKNGQPYQMVFFKIDGDGSARTYLSPANNNYSYWKPVLSVGAILSNLKWKDESRKLIDADSQPTKL